jgi:hypothetical protein
MSDSSWNPLIAEAFENMVEENDTRELGKFLAIANEYMQRDWINTNTSLVVSRETGGNDGDKNGSGYDLISSGGLRIQSKFRSGNFHLECTRRISKKNAGAGSSSGHVAYSAGEADVYVFTRPNGNFSDPSKAEIVAIPGKALEDPKNPGFLRRSVPKSIINKYTGRAVEILETLEKEND